MRLNLLIGALACIVVTQSYQVEGMYMLQHPQVQFCSADFVVRALVTHSQIKHHTYKVKVLDVFKDDVNVSKAEGTRISHGLKLKIHNSPHNVPLFVGKVYILAGRLEDGKLKMKMADWIFSLTEREGNKWKDVTPTQREGLFFLYRRGCECKIGRCSGDLNCSQKIPGCEYSALEKRPRFDDCRMKHQFCEMKKDQSGGFLCQWKSRPTNEFKECDNP